MEQVNNEIENVWEGLLPKKETQALKFIQDNPEWYFFFFFLNIYLYLLIMLNI